MKSRAAIQRLAVNKAALEARDGAGRTPLHVATFARQHKTVQALLQAGADPSAFEQGRYDAATIAAVANDEETLRVLLAGGASAKLTTSRYDGTALIAAAHLGHDGVVRQLIKAGAPLNHVNNLHWTTVIEAIVLDDGGVRHQAALKALLDAGASMQLADRSGATPLQLARARGYDPMVQCCCQPRLADVQQTTTPARPHAVKRVQRCPDVLSLRGAPGQALAWQDQNRMRWRTACRQPSSAWRGFQRLRAAGGATRCVPGRAVPGRATADKSACAEIQSAA